MNHDEQRPVERWDVKVKGSTDDVRQFQPPAWATDAARGATTVDEVRAACPEYYTKPELAKVAFLAGCHSSLCDWRAYRRQS